MNLEPTMKQVVIRRTVRRFAEERLAALDMDRSCRFPWERVREMAGLQYFGLEISGSYGGAGLDPVSAALVVEEISRVNAALGLCVTVHNSVGAYPVYTFGTASQKARFLGPLARGERIGTFCLTEPNAGSDISALETTAVRTGDGYVLNGNKVFVTNGGISGLNLVFVSMRGEGRRKIYSVFIVESENPGLEKGPEEDMMGMRGNPVCSISLQDCLVSEEHRLGKEGEGLRIALSTLNGGRIGIGAQAVGIAQACLDHALRYARERRQFGRMLGEFGAVQAKLADMATEVEAARLLVCRAAFLRGAGLTHGKEAAMAKLFSSDIAVRAARNGLQIHGGYGYTKAFPIERLYRDAKVCEIYEGTSEIQRIVIARTLAGEG